MEFEVLAKYDGDGESRVWKTVGAWLYPGDVLGRLRPGDVLGRQRMPEKRPSPPDLIRTAVEALEAAAVAAHDQVRLECCGRRSDGFCCGSPSLSWDDEDRAVMDVASERAKRLLKLLADLGEPQNVR